jgi:hypothetical protein
MEQQQYPLLQSFTALKAGKEFITQCHEMGFKNIQDILRLTPEELITKNGFSYHWLGELVSLLKKNQLLHLLQSIPGRTAY